MRFYNDFDPSCINNFPAKQIGGRKLRLCLFSIFLILYYLLIFVGNIPGVMKKISAKLINKK